MGILLPIFCDLTRRGFLLSGAAAISAYNALPAEPSCVLTPEGEEGPYYLNEEKVRQNITEGKAGLPLRLRIAVVDSTSCAPLPDAAIDIWHCDAAGVYSGFTSMSPDGGGRGRGRGFQSQLRRGPNEFSPDSGRVVDETRFLRGVQVSNKQGLAEFSTIYPGWYFGRAIHIHMKVHLGGHVSHTGQIYFPEDVTERVARLEPYAKRLSVHRTTQNEDGIFRSQHGAECMAKTERLEARSDEGGFLAVVTLAVDPTAIPAPVGMGGGRGRGRG